MLDSVVRVVTVVILVPVVSRSGWSTIPVIIFLIVGRRGRLYLGLPLSLALLLLLLLLKSSTADVVLLQNSHFHAIVRVIISPRSHQVCVADLDTVVAITVGLASVDCAALVVD